MIEDALSIGALGPALSSDLTKYLEGRNKITAAAARKRISRKGENVLSLTGLIFAHRARFLYLKKDYGSRIFWRHLHKAIYKNGGAYSHALSAVVARSIVPISDFHSSCGSPIAQKKHIGSSKVINILVGAGIFVEVDISGLGSCITTKEFNDKMLHTKHTIYEVRSRLIAERILLDAVKEWLRRLSIASFNKVKLRGENPTVGTFTWDLSAPSYLSPLTTWGETIKPGFVVCDVLLTPTVSLQDIKPFINKVKTLKSLKGIGKTLFIFVAQYYEPDALTELRSAGIMPATTGSLFGKDAIKSFKSLISLLSKAGVGSLEPKELKNTFKNLSKIGGNVNNMRGSFFELIVAHIVRINFTGRVDLNKKIKANKIGNEKQKEAEIDILLTSLDTVRVIECKGKLPNTNIDDSEIDTWLDKRINRVRQFIERTELDDNRKIIPVFELWTSGLLSDKSLERIRKTKEANKKKYTIEIVYSDDIRSMIKNDKSLLDTLEKHFLSEKVPKKKKGVSNT